MPIEWVQIFVQVIKSGSFTRAAEVMRLPKSTVSKAVSKLESETGTRLLLRTTRSQTLTAVGKVFYDSCAGPLQAIEDAQKSLSGNESLLVGKLKITAPEDMGTAIIAPTCGRIAIKHPGLTFELNYTNNVLDLIRDGYDLAIRIGPLNESGLKARKIGEIKLILVASMNYLKTYRKISRPDDLKDHSCLNLSDVKPLWRLHTSDGVSAQVTVRPRVISNQMSSLLQAARVSSGVALVPGFLAKPFIENQELVRVLPAWTSNGLAVHMLSPLAFSASSRLRLVSDEIADQLKRALEIK